MDLPTFSMKNDNLDDVIKFYQEKCNTVYNNESISDIFSDFFDFDLSAIDAWMENQFKCKILKNNITSQSFRKQGNSFFIKNNLKLSLQLYSKSLCYASPLSEEYTLAIANRSAVTFETKNYEDCLKDIDTCLVSSSYPKNLRHKLLLRKADCLRKLKRPEEFAICLDEISTFYNNLSIVGQDKYIDKYNKLKEFKEDNKNEKKTFTKTVSVLPNFETEENPDFAYASSKVEVRYSSVKGRHVVAKENISKGDILFLEKAFSFSPIFDVETRHINTEICYHCLKNTLSGISCDFCVRCIFCDTTCKEQAWKEYHKWECIGMQTDMWYHLGIALPAFKVLCKGLNASEIHMTSITKSKNCFGNKSNNYPYFDSLIYHIHKSINVTLVCSAIVVKYLSKYTNFFQTYITEPNCPKKNLHSLKKYVGSCIAKHILQLENNSTVIENWIDMNLSLPTEKQPVACGIFPSVSIMNHSCRPNISNFFICDTIVVKALKDIEQNEEILNCYGVDYRVMRKNERQKRLHDLYNFECKCVICIDPSEEMKNFDTFICIKCGYNISEHEEHRFCYCGNCKSRIDFYQLREINDNFEEIPEGKIDEISLMRCFNQRKQFLNEKHSDLQDTRYKLYQFYARKGEFNKVITYFELWLENEKIRIGENAQILGHLLYEVGLLVVKSLETDNNYYENHKHLYEKAHIFLQDAKTICSLYYPEYFIEKMRWK